MVETPARLATVANGSARITGVHRPILQRQNLFRLTAYLDKGNVFIGNQSPVSQCIADGKIAGTAQPRNPDFLSLQILRLFELRIRT